MSLPDYITISPEPRVALKEVISQSSPSKIAVLVDENTKANCLPFVQDSLDTFHLIEITSGERYKTLATCEHIWSELTAEGFDRNGLLINLGGGVIGDMGGFAAACFNRGIDESNPRA